MNEVYAHIGNGGIDFKVTNEYGPTIEIRTTHFGNQTNHIKVSTTKQVLAALADMFRKAADDTEYADPYVHAAELVADEQVEEATDRWVYAIKNARFMLEEYKKIPTGVFGAVTIANIIARYDNGERTQELLEELESIE